MASHLWHDLPAGEPKLGFSEYARILNDMIRNADPPQFTIGVLGGYGTGKTTLMKAMMRGLDNELTFTKVWFDAWRFDRDENLLPALLLTLRQAVPPESEEWGILHNTCRALVRGISLELGPVKFDASKAVEAEASIAEKDRAKLTSLYVDMLKELSRLTIPTEKGGFGHKFVIFIDDLDRCLPLKAFELLENIKAFTDIPGFVFVIGLDVRVIKSYIESKYGETFCIDPTEYVEKLFQVPFQIPTPNGEAMIALVKELGQAVFDDDKSVKTLGQFAPSNVRQIKRILTLCRLLKNVTGDSVSSAAILGVVLWHAVWRKSFVTLLSRGDEFCSELIANGPADKDRKFKAYFDSILRPLLMNTDDRKAILALSHYLAAV